MKLKRKFTFIIIVFIIIATVMIYNIINTQKILEQIEAERVLLNGCLEGIFELNLLTNEYILHANERILQQWETNYQQLNNDLQIIFETTETNSKIKLIQTRIKEDYQFLGKTFLDLQTVKRNDDLYEIYIGKMNLKSVDIVYQMFDLKREIYNGANRASKQHVKSLLIGLSVIMLMIFMVFYAFLKQVLQPLKKIREDIKIIGKGNLQHKIEIKRYDEIGELAVSFNEMTEDLGKTIASRNELNVQMEEIKKMEKEREMLMAKLQDSNKQLENFAYVASHDLQEPLRKMISFSGLLAKHLNNDLDEKGLKFMNYITSGAERMQKLILDLLSFSRIDTRGKDPETTDMNQLLEHVQDELSMLIAENDAVINIEKFPKMKVDASQLSMVFQNLINNGIKFRGDRKPEINIKCTEKDDKWLISVQDNGIGIDPDFKDKIFVIFQRLHSASEYPGTGIGLALVKKIIERHNGRIWVESEPGKGSTFFVELPKEM